MPFLVILDKKCPEYILVGVLRSALEVSDGLYMYNEFYYATNSLLLFFCT